MKLGGEEADDILQHTLCLLIFSFIYIYVARECLSAVVYSLLTLPFSEQTAVN